uniref:Uncharacterized protein n=1 Tax=Peronospora matthiolae TaxID=2874970 RepID=A0AAV1UUY2_9STRA
MTEPCKATSYPTEAELQTLTQRLHTRLTTRGRASLTRRQVRVLLQDVVLVASGLRPSCLVDCCALTTKQTTIVLEVLQNETNSGQWQWLETKHVRALQLDGNVFFVHVTAFVHEKMVELATDVNDPLVVNVNANLSRPQLVSKKSSATSRSRAKAFAKWTVSACKDLLLSTNELGVLEWKRPSTLAATAVAGRLLCYPYVYDTLEADESNKVVEMDTWSAQDNCLGLCPLWLLKTTIAIPSQQLEMVLQEFSIPQHLLDKGDAFCIDRGSRRDGRSLSPLLKVLRARCQLKLQRASDQSRWTTKDVQVQVRVEGRTLHRVAL